MISGALPALMVFFIRLFVPESKKWEHEKARGATSHWSNGDLLGVSVGCLASIAIIWSWSPAGVGPGAAALITAAGVAAALWGFLFPVRRYLARAVSAGSLAPHQQRWSSSTCCLAQASPAWRCSARGDRSSGRRAGHFSSSPTRASSRGNTRRSAPRSAPSSSPSSWASPREDSAAASHTPRCAWDRSCRACSSTRATNGSTGSFCSRFFWPAASPRVLRIVPSLSAGALSDRRARNRAGILVQLRTHSRRRRRPADSDAHGILRRKLSDGGISPDGVLRRGAGDYLVRTGDARQAAARINS